MPETRSPLEIADAAGWSDIIDIAQQLDEEHAPTGRWIGVRLTDGKYGCDCGSVAIKIRGYLYGCAMDRSHGCINHSDLRDAVLAMVGRLDRRYSGDGFTREG